MLNYLLTWVGMVGLIVGPFLLGAVFEQKLQPAERDLGSRLLHRY